MCACDHRYRRIFTLEGAWQLVCKLVHCPNPDCVGRHRTFSPQSELGIAPPFWATGWDVFCWIGHSMPAGEAAPTVSTQERVAWDYCTAVRCGRPAAVPRGRDACQPG